MKIDSYYKNKVILVTGGADNVIKLRRKIYNLSVIARIPITIGRRSNLVNIKRLTLLRALPLPNSFLVRNDDNIINLMILIVH